MLRRTLFLLTLASLALPALFAAGPRWVASRPQWNNDGQAIAW